MKRRTFMKYAATGALAMNLPNIPGISAATVSDKKDMKSSLAAYVVDDKLKFNSNGEFKIVQFTDTHFKYGVAASDVALERIDEIMESEKPDLVIFTGDVVYNAPADKGMRQILGHVSKYKVPFAVVFGNHDEEQGMTLGKLYDVIRSVDYNIQPDRGEIESPDYVLTIKSSKGNEDAAILYCLDSHSSSKLESVKGYDWIHSSQINWYREESEMLKERNNGKTLPALAFFHIPLREYNEASSNENTILYGHRMERACSPNINSGMFAAVKEMGDVMGIFVGHDHDNDYSLMWRDVLLAYGRYTGGNTEYNHLPNGARVIVLKENERKLVTWICEKGGRRSDITTYPDSYVKDDWHLRDAPREVL